MKLQTLISPSKAKAELCKRSFYYFFKEFWDIIIPEQMIDNWHIKFLCDELQQVVEKVKRREPKDYDVIINISPGTSKSTIVTVMLPVWAWVIDPTIRNLSASYCGSLSTDHAMKSRDIIRSDKFVEYFPGLEIKKDQDNKTHYKNNHGGERYATSVTGSVIGFHAHLIVVDDPLTPKGASSEADRLTANNFMDVTLSTRKVNKSMTPTILVMQRLHQKDCTGNWLDKEGKKIKHICIPGELSPDVKPEFLREKYVNGLMDVTRLTRDDLTELKVNLGSYGYAGQIMQTPSPLDGGIWKQWLIPIPRAELPLQLSNIGTDWDLAYTEKETNSASAYVTSGKYQNKMFIFDLGFKWLEFPKLMDYMKSKRQPHYIEAKASGKSAKQTLTNSGIPAVEVNVKGGDKIARATMATPYCESGLVYICEDLLNMLYFDDRQGILMFPNNEHDDLQDALVQGINRQLGGNSFFVI